MAEPYEHLPDLLARVADAAGEDAALLVAKEWGGTEVYLPKVLPTDHRLVRLLGRRRAEAVLEELGAGEILIPLGPLASDMEKRAAIRKLLEEGLPHHVVARREHVHVRTVYRIAANMRRSARDEDQISLF